MQQAIAPTEAVFAATPPEGPDWQFEPKWDGFRAIAVRDGDAVTICSKSGKAAHAVLMTSAAILD